MRVAAPLRSRRTEEPHVHSLTGALERSIIVIPAAPYLPSQSLVGPSTVMIQHRDVVDAKVDVLHVEAEVLPIDLVFVVVVVEHVDATGMVFHLKPPDGGLSPPRPNPESSNGSSFPLVPATIAVTGAGVTSIFVGIPFTKAARKVVMQDQHVVNEDPKGPFTPLDAVAVPFAIFHRRLHHVPFRIASHVVHVPPIPESNADGVSVPNGQSAIQEEFGRMIAFLVVGVHKGVITVRILGK
mmetsp:Transcript_74714/g.178253  ORF Transcript_74714/g.178253 Transcript_74714/m.178253 type:complete len:240 (+) Transcript_74714:190-909(+)